MPGHPAWSVLGLGAESKSFPDESPSHCLKSNKGIFFFLFFPLVFVSGHAVTQLLEVNNFRLYLDRHSLTIQSCKEPFFFCTPSL